MSTIPIPNPAGAAVTGQEADFENFLRQTIAEEVAKTQKAPDGQTVIPPSASPIAVNLNGQNFQFTSQDELNRALTNTFSQYNSEIQRLRDAQAAPAAKGSEVTGNEEPAFDINTFVTKMTTNPVDAFDYVDEFRYGVKNPAEAVKGAIAGRAKVDELNQALAVYRFRDAHPEFDPQAAPVMQEIIKATGLSSDFNGLESAYALGVMKGVIRPLQSQNQQFQQAPPQNPFQPSQQAPPMYSQNPYGGGQFQDPRLYNGGFNNGYNPAAPPPRPGRTEMALPQNIESMAEGMTPEQIEAVFARFSG